MGRGKEKWGRERTEEGGNEKEGRRKEPALDQ